jgi:uncharacterized membrane protein
MTSPRWAMLDAARGLAVLAMVVFHLIWDLGHFGYIEASIPWSAPVRAFGHSIAFSFLFIAGLSLSLAHRREFRPRAFWRRLAIVAGAAALVSAGTYVAFPTALVFFGILHCIAAASLLSVPFLFLPWPAALAAGVLFFVAPWWLASPAFDSKWLLWLGLSTIEPSTLDWRPLFPWAGATLLGVGAGGFLLSRFHRNGGGVSEGSWRSGSGMGSESGPREWLPFLGRHSLPIYLGHQPLLFAIFAALVIVAPPPENTGAFIAACEKGCLDEGAEPSLCHDACVCTAQEAMRSKALENVADEGERGRLLKAIAARCMKK